MKALITGGSRGIGLAVAEQLASQGYQVWLVARDLGRLQASQQTLAERDLHVQIASLDVADAFAVRQIFAEIGELQILVNAAGASGLSVLEDSHQALNQWEQMLRTNLTGTYSCCLAALPYLARPGGRIVNIASVLGLRGMRLSAAYCASKHGVVGLTRALALDLAEQGITVNAVCPGWVDTEMAQADFQALGSHYGIAPAMLIEDELNAVPIGRWIEPAEVAGLVSYLCSSQAAAITGQALEISGGL